MDSLIVPLLVLVGVPFVIRIAFEILKSLLRSLFRGARSSKMPAFHTCRVKVLDGDTVFSRPGDHKIRLFGIDAPESAQPQGPQSTDFLRRLTEGHDIDIHPVERDRYNRIVARLVRHSDKLDINAAMVANGFALAETRYSRDYLRHQRQARNEKLGLWQNGGIDCPRNWRAANS